MACCSFLVWGGMLDTGSRPRIVWYRFWTSDRFFTELSPKIFKESSFQLWLQVMPASALADVSQSLRYLNLSFNQIQHLDSTMFSNSLKLISLSLSNNRLTILPDNIFMGLSSLLTLDLSHNPIRANFKELFHYTQQLKDLRLSHTSLQSVPSLPLPGKMNQILK